MKVECFGGRVTFDVHHLSPLRHRLWNEYQGVMAAHSDFVDPNHNAYMDALAFCLPRTKAIEFHFQGNETDMLTDFKVWAEKWIGLDKCDIAAAWADFAQEGDNFVIYEWRRAVNKTTEPFIDPETAPESALTEAQLAEAHDPSSPLAESVGKTKKAG